MQTGETRSRLPVANQESCPMLLLSEPAGLLNPSHGTGHPHRCPESRFLVISEDTESTALSKSAPLCPLSPQLCKTRRSPSDEKGSKSLTIILFKLKAKAGLGAQAGKPDTGAGDRGEVPTTHEYSVCIPSPGKERLAALKWSRTWHKQMLTYFFTKKSVTFI